MRSAECHEKMSTFAPRKAVAVPRTSQGRAVWPPPPDERRGIVAPWPDPPGVRSPKD